MENNQVESENSLQSPKHAGIAMLSGMLLALIWANSPYASFYEQIHHAPMSIQVGEFVLSKPMISWINEGLMVFFFFLVGLEIKREIVEGQLSSLRQMALPGISAIGGMAVPALIYLAFNADDSAAAGGWAIPAATDIVLALAFLSLLGNRVPTALKVFLTALALFDDLGALIIIAVVYSENIGTLPLVLSLIGIAIAVIMNRLQVARVAAYILIGTFLWVAVLRSGVHATLSGVILAFLIPMRINGREFSRTIEYNLTPWVSLFVIPVFAFFNAGIDLGPLSFESLLDPISIGVVLGLFIGKQVGIYFAARVAVFSRLAVLPPGVGWLHVYGVSLLAGVGFTMSLFITDLAFNEPGAVLTTNFSVILGSLLSAVTGMAVLYIACRSSNR